jgi:hypothetical protein
VCRCLLKVADRAAFGPAGTLAPAPLTLGEQRERQENRVRSDEARLQMLESRLQAP